jgi:uncharacterized membrane protein YgcG
MKKITFLVASILIAGGAYAQTAPAAPVDSRFASWLGCWRLDDDLAGTGARMCITPDAGGVRLQTVVGANKGIDELVLPDGVARPIVDAECKGTEQSSWSQDGARIFRTTDVTCGKEPPRTVKTMAFLAPGPSWIHVQHVSGQSAAASVRVQRYRRAANQTLADGSKAQQPEAAAALRTTADQTRWSIEDVIEASSKMPAAAIQAALTEARHPFPMNKRTLLALDRGHVDESVIDLMVALTYPRKFVVERRGGSNLPSGVTTGGGWFDPFMTGTMAGSFDCFTPYGYGYRSYYSLCGSPYYYSAMGMLGYGLYDYHRYNPFGYYGWVDVGHFPQIGTGGGTIEPQAEGRVIAGRGFTQIRLRESEPTPRVNAGGNGGAWGGAGGGGVSSGGGFSNGGSSSGSSGGNSGAGESGARVAVPKGGGGQ